MKSLIIPLSIIAFESLIQLHEHNMRYFLYKAAEEESRKRKKPLLVIGRPKGRHGFGDICLDIEGCECIYGNDCISFIADVRELSKLFDEKSVVTFCSHVLEHLSLDDCKKAIKEIKKVSDIAFILYPNKYSLIARIATIWNYHKIETLEYLWSINPKGYFIIE